MGVLERLKEGILLFIYSDKETSRVVNDLLSYWIEETVEIIDGEGGSLWERSGMNDPREQEIFRTCALEVIAERPSIYIGDKWQGEFAVYPNRRPNPSQLNSYLRRKEKTTGNAIESLLGKKPTEAQEIYFRRAYRDFVRGLLPFLRNFRSRGFLTGNQEIRRELAKVIEPHKNHLVEVKKSLGLKTKKGAGEEGPPA